MMNVDNKEEVIKVLVLHCSTFVGGAEYSLLELLHKLGNRPVELHLVVSEQIVFQHVRAGICFHPIRLNYLKRADKTKTVISCLTIIPSAIKLLRLVRSQKIKVVYCNTFRTLPYCFLIKWFLPVRIVCHCRDHFPSGRMSQHLFPLADDWITVSKHIQAQFPASVRTHVVYNGIDPTVFQPVPPTGILHRTCRLPLKTVLIGNIGQILPWKNQRDFLSVAYILRRQHRNIHFFLAGTAVDEEYESQLQEYITQLGMEQYVTFTGYVHPASEYLAEFDVVVHTALNEPFGRVVIEAGAMGKPVIAYLSGGPAEIIRDGETGYLVREGDIKQMAEHVSQLIRQPLLAKSMGRLARERVVSLFNSEDYANHVYQILQHGSCPL